MVGNLIFISGCTGQDTITGKPTAKTFEDQMIIALRKVKMAMEEAGSSMDNIVKTVILLKNLDNYPKMRRTEVEFYQENAPYLVENPPASTLVAPASLAKPEFLVEVDVNVKKRVRSSFLTNWITNNYTIDYNIRHILRSI